MNRFWENAAVVVTGDDWEGLYINGKLVEEAHNLEEGEERVLYFLSLQSKYEFNINELRFAYPSNEDIFKCEEDGGFPVNVKDFKKITYKGDKDENY